jgi:mono/diheme cytochrome c family protein
MAGLMNRLGRIAIYTGLTLIVLLALAVTLTVGWRPILGPKKRAVIDRQFQVTPARLQRGEYLVENVALCYGCHTRFDAKGKEKPVFTAPKGSGQVMVNQANFRVVAPNITPDRNSGIGRWTDDEVGRAIREGISRDGRALFPMMPYANFRNLSDEDIASIVVYLRAQKPAASDIGRTSLPFPVSRLINAAPQPVNGPVAAPNPADPVAYGKYLVTTVADCNGCHTPRDKHGNAIPNMDFGGGNIFDESGVSVVSANITPDPSGIGYYDEATFVQTMRTGRVHARPLNVMMPWWAFKNMTDSDLKAMYAYLRTLKPVRHRIDNSETATLCPIDGQKHGLGDKN